MEIELLPGHWIYAPSFGVVSITNYGHMALLQPLPGIPHFPVFAINGAHAFILNLPMPYSFCLTIC